MKWGKEKRGKCKRKWKKGGKRKQNKMGSKEKG
jgi:hypothetical protein